MKIKWSKEAIKYFNRPIMKAERSTDWGWWGLFGMLIIMEIIILLKILEKI